MGIILRRTNELAALGGVVLVAPLMILEWATSSDLPRTHFPPLLFAVLWVLTFVVIRTALAVLETSRTARVSGVRWIPLMRQSTVAVVFGWGFVSLVVDQMLCFLGAGGC